MSLEATFNILLYPQVIKVDIPQLTKNVLKRIKLDINKKLRTSPEVFGKPLRKSLKGFRSLRSGTYRVIFEIQNRNVEIIMISHRSIVYKKAFERLGKKF